MRSRIEYRLFYVMALKQRDIVQRKDALANPALEVRPPGEDQFEPAVRTKLPAPELMPEEVARQIAAKSAVGDELIHDRGEIMRQDAKTVWRHTMAMLSLWNAPSAHGVRGQFIALYDRDAFEVVCECTGCAEPRHAAAEHDGMLAIFSHVAKLLSLSATSRGPRKAISWPFATSKKICRRYPPSSIFIASATTALNSRIAS